MFEKMRIRRLVAVGAVGLAGVGLAACSSSSSSTAHAAGTAKSTTTTAPVTGASKAALALSVPQAKANVGPVTSCGTFGNIPQLVCAAWKKLTPAQLAVLPNSGYGDVIVRTVAVTGKTATVTYCVLETHPGLTTSYWVPTQVKLVEVSNVWKTSPATPKPIIDLSFSCKSMIPSS